MRGQSCENNASRAGRGQLRRKSSQERSDSQEQRNAIPSCLPPIGVIETIRSAEYGRLHPNSVAVLRSGVIYVGMRYFVTRLTPKGSSYEEDWLLPSDCPGYRFVCDELPKALLIARLTVAEAEARLKPLSEFTTKEWERLRRQMQPGDELWTWGNVLGAGGIALVRNGDPVASIDAWRKLNERR
jgi:hypothetical protein